MKHVFLIKPLDALEEHPFVPVIKEVMKDLDYDIHYSGYKDDVRNIIGQYHEPVRFYSVGGDGFFNQVVQCLVHTDHEVVVIPYGTGNDFSRMIHPRKTPRQILCETLGHKAVKVDSVIVNEKLYYINVACFGLDAVIANNVHEEDAPLLPRKGAYVASLLRNIAGYPFYDVKVETGDQVLYEGKVTLCAFCNGRYYGGGFEIAPQAYINDGYLDIVILPQVKKSRSLHYIHEIVHKKLAEDEKTFTARVKECTVSTAAAMNYDGEKAMAIRYHLRLVPASLNLIL